MTKHLPLLSILHYVYGGLILFGAFAALAFVGIGSFIVTDLVPQQPDEPPREIVAHFLQAFGGVLFIILAAFSTLLFLSGYWVSRRRNRMVSIVLSAVCLLSFPLGTALGIFSLIVLSDDAVKKEYEMGRPMDRVGMPGA